MQHVLGMILGNSLTEVFDNDTPGDEPYSFMGLYAAMAEGDKRMRANPNILKINVYEVFDGKKRISSEGRYQLVHCLVREGVPMPGSK